MISKHRRRKNDGQQPTAQHSHVLAQTRLRGARASSKLCHRSLKAPMRQERAARVPEDTKSIELVTNAHDVASRALIRVQLSTQQPCRSGMSRVTTSCQSTSHTLRCWFGAVCSDRTQEAAKERNRW